MFRPLSEQQVIQQVVQNKKYESVNISETISQLCKKLAEKRVFGSRLMSLTTVAAPNHSSYSNLPIKGIIYIQRAFFFFFTKLKKFFIDVCRRVLGNRIKSDDEFWEYFREAMRKLAARCRRVRHAKKMRSPKLDSETEKLSKQQLLQCQLVQQPNSLTTVVFKASNNNETTENVSNKQMEINNDKNNVFIKSEIVEPMCVCDESITSGASGETDSLLSTSPHTSLSSSSQANSKNTTPNPS